MKYWFCWCACECVCVCSELRATQNLQKLFNIHYYATSSFEPFLSFYSKKKKKRKICFLNWTTYIMYYLSNYIFNWKSNTCNFIKQKTSQRANVSSLIHSIEMVYSFRRSTTMRMWMVVVRGNAAACDLGIGQSEQCFWSRQRARCIFHHFAEDISLILNFGTRSRFANIFDGWSV